MQNYLSDLKKREINQKILFFCYVLLIYLIHIGNNVREIITKAGKIRTIRLINV